MAGSPDRASPVMELRHRRGRLCDGRGMLWNGPHRGKDLGGSSRTQKLSCTVRTNQSHLVLAYLAHSPSGLELPLSLFLCPSLSIYLFFPPHLCFVEPSLRQHSTLIIIVRHSEMRPRYKCSITSCNSRGVCKLKETRTIWISGLK